MKIIGIILALVLPGLIHQTSPRGWRGIVPLHSTRADVEALLGGPGTNECKCSYYRDDFNAFFDYSTGYCEGGGWDVPPDTVLYITVHEKHGPQLADLGMDKSKLKKVHGIGETMYFGDNELWLSLEVYEGRVRTFRYYPSQADRHLKCPEKSDAFDAPNLAEEDRPALLQRLNDFVEYGRSQQYEKQFDLYLPQFADMMFGATNSNQYAEQALLYPPFRVPVVEFKPETARKYQDSMFGEVWTVSGPTKILVDGEVTTTYQTIRLVLRQGQWYFVDHFRPNPL